jgi:hypothetical protein
MSDPLPDPRELALATKLVFYALARRAGQLLDCLGKGAAVPDVLEDAVARGRKHCIEVYVMLQRWTPQIECLHPPEHQFSGFPGPSGGVEAVLVYARSVLAEAVRRRGGSAESTWNDVPYEALRRLPPGWAMSVIKQEFVLLEKTLQGAPGSGVTGPATDGPAPDRIQCDPETQTVTLGGTDHKVDEPRAFALYKAIVDNCPQPLTRADLRSRVKACKGEKTIRKLLDLLPLALRKTVRSGPHGYWFDADGDASPRRRKNGRQIGHT